MRSDILATAGLDVSNFDKGIEKIVKSGAKAVSSLASLSNPIIAVGAALATTVAEYLMGLKELENQEAKLLVISQKRAKANKELAENAIAAIKAASAADRERLFGKDEAGKLNRLEEHQKRVQEIRNQRGEGSGFEEEEVRRYNAIEALIQHVADAEMEATRTQEKADIRASEARREQLQREIEGEADLAKIQRLRREADEAERKKAASGGGLAWSKLEEERLGKLKEIADIERKIAKDAESAAKKASREILDNLNETIQAQTKAAENAIQKAKEVAEEKKRQAKEVADAQERANEKTGEAFDAAVDRTMMTPSERKRADAETRKRNRVARTIETQDRIRGQNRARGAYGQRGVNTTSDAMAQKSRASFAARNAPKITAATIEAATLTVQVIKPK